MCDSDNEAVVFSEDPAGSGRGVGKQALYKKIVENSNDAIAIIDPQGRYLEQNAAHRLLIGYSDKELEGKTPAIHFGEEAFARVVSALAETGEFRGEITSVTKSGDRRDIELAAFALRDESGEVVCYVGIKRDVTPRKKVERELRESEAFKAQLLSILPLGVYTCDTSGVITSYNKRACEMWGRVPAIGDPSDRYGGSLRMYTLDGEPIPHARSPMGLTVQDGIPRRDHEIVIERPDGTRIVALVNPSPIRDAQGAMIGAVNCVLDITARKRVEEELRRREQTERQAALENEALANISRIISSSLDIENVYQRFAQEVSKLIPFAGLAMNVINHEAQTFTHISSTDVKGRRPSEVYPLAGTATEEAARLRRPLMAQMDDVNELKLRLPGLAPLIDAGFNSFLVSPLISHGRVIGSLGFHRWQINGFSEHEAAMAERVAIQIVGAIANALLYAENARLYRRAEEHRSELQTLFDSITECVISMDSELRVDRANLRALRMLDTAEDDLSGRRVSEALNFTDETGAQPFNLEGFIKDCMERKEACSTEEVWLKNSGGKLIPIALTAAPEHNEDTHSSRAVLVFNDISHRRAVDEMRDTIISHVSHELRTPLTHIKGCASSLLQGDVSWDDKQKDYFVRTIDKQADRLTNLVDNLLELSRIQSGQIPLQVQPVSPAYLVKEGVRQAAPFLASHKVVIDVPASLPEAMAEASRLERVLVNLLENAAKYSSPGTTIRVSASTADEKIAISVADNGIGIPSDAREMVFGKFVRLHGGDDSQVSGTGLGLALCKAIVEAHGGKIWVESEPGKGATFIFTIPANPATRA